MKEQKNQLRLGLEVFGEIELIESISSGQKHYSHCISIRNPHEEQSPEIDGAFQEILELRFYDIESVELLPQQYKHRRTAQSDDIRKVRDFVSATINKSSCTGYTIHCWRGVSRSAAVALGILYMLYGSETEAVEHLQKIRPSAAPLPRILRFWDEISGSNLEEAGEWIRFNLYQQMQRDLAEDRGAETHEVTFDKFRQMRKTMDKKEQEFIEEFDSAD